MSLKELRDEINRLTRSRDNFQKEMKEALVNISIAQRFDRAAAKYLQSVQQTLSALGGETPKAWTRIDTTRLNIILVGSDRGLAKGLHGLLLAKLLAELPDAKTHLNKVLILGNRTARDLRTKLPVTVNSWRRPLIPVARGIINEMIASGDSLKVIFYTPDGAAAETLLPPALPAGGGQEPPREPFSGAVMTQLDRPYLNHAMIGAMIFARFWRAITLTYLQEQKLRFETTSNARDVTQEIIDATNVMLQRLRQNIITTQVQENQITRMLSSGGSL